MSLVSLRFVVWDHGGMANRPAPALVLREGDLEQLRRLTRSSTVKAGLAQRARIVLLAADGVSNTHIAQTVGVSRPTVLAWRDRYQVKGIEGLEDEPRAGRPRQVDHGQIVSATLAPPPKKHGVTHWSSRLLVAPGDRQWHRREGLAGVRGSALAERDLQVLHRPGAGRQGHRCGRALPGASRERGRAVRGREVPDSGAGSHRAAAADATGSARAANPRLQAPRNLHPLQRWRSRPAPSPRPARSVTAIRSSWPS